jgi:enolase
MNNKSIIKAINRVHAEKCKEITILTERLSTLAHQIQYYNEMHESYQNMVLEDLFSDMDKYEWHDWVKELKEEIKSNEEKKE